MIKKESFTKEWIESFRQKRSNRRIDPSIVEKMIWALNLLEHLANSGLKFVFKGGTSLMLLLEKANRFSVDIDITTEEDRTILEAALNTIIDKSDFIKYVLDEKRSYKIGIPKAHYKFYYQTINEASTKIHANYILLDIVFEKSVYSEISNVEIITDWLITEKPYNKVIMPSINSILGDKLTAFAPNTTGVLYQKGKELEICKQLYDVSVLIDEAINYNIVYRSFIETVQKEIKYRSLSISENDVLDDIFETALLIARRDKNRGQDAVKFTEIKTGLRNFTNYIITSNFRIEEAIVASAKAAYIAMKFKNYKLDNIELYNSEVDLSKIMIFNKDYQFLNKLKKSNKQAFYYWYKCVEEITL